MWGNSAAPPPPHTHFSGFLTPRTQMLPGPQETLQQGTRGVILLSLNKCGIGNQNKSASRGRDILGHFAICLGLRTVLRTEMCSRLFLIQLQASHWLHLLLRKEPVRIPPTKQSTFGAVPQKGVSGALGAEQNYTGGTSNVLPVELLHPMETPGKGQFPKLPLSFKNQRCWVGGYKCLLLTVGWYLGPTFHILQFLL